MLIVLVPLRRWPLMVQPADPNRPKRPRQNRLAALVPGMIEPALRQRGFASAALLQEWPEIAGAALAQRTAPLEIRWPKRSPAGEPPRLRQSGPRQQDSRMKERAEGATLVVACPGAFALELQMQAGRLIEAANRRIGFGAITRLEIRQEPLPGRPVRAQKEPPSEAMIAAFERELSGIADDRLRRALSEWGADVARRGRDPTTS